MAQSKKYSLNKADAKSILVTVGFVIVSAVVPTLIDIVLNTDFGQYTVIVVPLGVAVLKGIQKYAAGK